MLTGVHRTAAKQTQIAVRLWCTWRLSTKCNRVMAASVSSNTEKKQVIILTGPTAVGKTAASLDLAYALNGEIVGADSVQIYKDLDIGSAKLPEAERRGIPHHMIDVAMPGDDFSAGSFFDMARSITTDILQRGHTPIVVGGTGFYLRWFIYGKPTTPVSTPESSAAAQRRLDEVWAAEAARQGVSELTPEDKWTAGAKLVDSLGDPESAARLLKEYNNYYRLNRVVEILILSSGMPLATFDLDTEASLEWDFRCFFLDRPRPQLFRRLDQRCEMMVRDGMLRECAQLLNQGFEPDSNSATRAIGYRQGMEALQQWRRDPASLTPASMLEMVDKMQTGTRQYAHRQIKWARGVELFQWLDAQQETSEIVDQIVNSLNGPPYTGDSGGRGLLDAQGQNEMKRYMAHMTILNDETVLQQICNETKMLLEQPVLGIKDE